MGKTEYDAHIFNNRFKVDLSEDITKVSSIVLQLDKIESTTGNHHEHKVFIPGIGTFGTITFQGAEHKDGVKKIREWVKTAYDGNDARKSVTVELHNQKGETIRTFHLHECFPIAYNTIDMGSQGGRTTISWTLDVRVTRVEMA